MRPIVYLVGVGCAVVYGSQWIADLSDAKIPAGNPELLRQQGEDERLQNPRLRQQGSGAAIADHEMRLERAARVLSRIVTCVNTHVVRHQEREAIADCNYYDDEAVAFHEDESSGRISSEESNALMQQAEDSPRIKPE